MTTPRTAVATRHGRHYPHPGLAGRLVPSVTTITGVLDRPGLNSWRVRAAATYAVTHAAWVADQAATDPIGAIDHIRHEGTRQAVKAAVRGTRVHHLAQAVAQGRPVPDHSEDEAAYLTAYLAFLADRRPEFVATETTVYSTSHAYAGTLDWLARIDGALVLGDIKTKAARPGRDIAIYPEVALQLAALAHADLINTPDGSPVPMPTVDAAVALHLSPSGYKLHPVVIDGWVWDAFLGLRAAWTFAEHGPTTITTLDPTAPIPARSHPTHPETPQAEATPAPVPVPQPA